MYFNKGLPNTFVSKNSSFTLSLKHNPIAICNNVGDRVSYFYGRSLADGSSFNME
jgi:hypothetical protein